MDYVRWCIMLLVIAYASGQIPIPDGAIRINSSEPQKYVVEENQTLSIYFSNFSVSHGWCYDYYNHAPILETTRPPSVSNSCIHFSIVTKNMSTLWECTVGVEKSAKGIVTQTPKLQMYYFKFKLHVKGAKRISMIINGRHMEFTYNNVSDPYDGFTNYIYKENENINATCLNIEQMGTVQLFYAKTGVKSRAVFNSTLLMINLHIGLNNSYLDCEYTSEKPEDKYLYRVYFISGYKPFSKREFLTSSSGSNNNTLYILLGCFSGLILISTVTTVYWYMKVRTSTDTETNYNDLIEEKTMTPTPELMYDSCYSENVATNDGPKSSEYSDPYYHSYAEVNYLQCKPRSTENQQRTSAIYNVPYDHSRKYFSGK